MMNKHSYVAPDIDNIQVHFEAGFGASQTATIELEYGNETSADD